GPEGPGRPWVVAVDAPSGIGVDDGTVPGPVLRADRTVTFGAAKPGLLLPPATHLAGHGAVVDIGLRLGAPGPHAPGADAAGLGAPGPDAPGPCFVRVSPIRSASSFDNVMILEYITTLFFCTREPCF
ncbi:NAD(P)H-hydrate epimerase, partial [Cellulosimicrobium funkei]|uniref:NAD(P)H-hydrate epimerase n=1 Tax=Cellulosimicrobium funkei TaxID=264251 RepID=UPI00375798D9